MAKTLNRRFSLYGDVVDVIFFYNEPLDKYFGDYPDFDKSPRTTACGRRWVNATKDDCPYTDKEYGDCGSCRYFQCEHPGDLIGVCDNEELRKEVV